MSNNELYVVDSVMEDKFNYLKNNRVSSEILDYLSNRFVNLKIEMYGQFVGDIIDFMNKGLLMGWCFQTTETAILFLDDEDYIIRGVLRLNKNKKYYHSWIVFNYNNIDYVFDPCLNFVTTKELYDKVFDVEIRGKVGASLVKESFIDYVNNSPKKSRFKEDTNDPMYRNKGIKYKMELENGKVKKLVAHYHLGDCSE